MATIEQVEKLREKANITYDEAKTALEVSGDDILEAMIYLERAGKILPPKNNGYYSSKCQEEPDKGSDAKTEYSPHNYETFAQLFKRFLRWCGKLIARGNANMFEVWKNDKAMISVPVTVLVLLLIFAFWVVVPLIVIGLFFGCRYFFKGPDLEKTGVNRMMDSAANAAENIKKEVKDGHNDK